MIRSLLPRLFLIGIMLGLTNPLNNTKPIPHPEPYAVVLTYSHLERISAYNAVSSQTDDTPHISSCGPNKARQIAISQDIFFKEGKKHLCGVRVSVYTSRGEYFKDYVVYDTMNRRYENTADILIDGSVAEARAFGITDGWLVFHD